VSGKEDEIVRTRLEQLLAEQRTIIAWDQDYAGQDAPDEVDRTAWEARRRRLAGISEEVRILKEQLRAQTGTLRGRQGLLN
jgi:hypothetical protein